MGLEAGVHPGSTADGTRRRARTVLVVLALFIVINAADKAVLGLTADPIRDELGLTATEFGTVAGSFYLLFSVSAVAVGFLGDRIRTRPLLAALALVWAAAQLPILLPAAGFGALVATRVVLGAGEGPGYPLANYTAFTWFPGKERSLPSAVVVAGGAGGTVVAAPLVILVSNTLGWRASFGLLGGIGILWMLAWLRLGGSGPYAARLDATAAVGDAVSGAVPGAADGEVPFRRIVTTGTWLGATFSAFTVMWTLAIGFAWLPLFLEEQAGFSDAEISGILGLPALSMAVLVLTSGIVAQRLLRRGTTARVAQGLLGALLPLLAGACLLLTTRAGPGVTLLLPLVVAFSAGNGQTPLTNSAIADICPPGRRSAALGLSYALAALSSLLAPYVTGRIIDAAPSEALGYGRAFDLAAWLLIAGGVISMLLVRPDRDAQLLGTQRRSDF
ncbi:MFS transporter [Streptomyces sp. NBC_01750]|uniref:MFS transporter n=1 Tax=Streptomyces sp. NBC_01750 TaxID=2975928 RepID=UPI002DD9BE48|nr:MFS transporter [Streptomyces sp. NBC_01750]WSD31012.1 MFS transporter [Streptomyces sp. NBC_01750]